MTRSALTEDTPSTPGWVERRVAELFAPLGQEAVAVRDRYLACLAAVGGATDLDAGHDRCRLQAVSALGAAAAAGLDQALQALEADITRDLV